MFPISYYKKLLELGMAHGWTEQDAYDFIEWAIEERAKAREAQAFYDRLKRWMKAHPEKAGGGRSFEINLRTGQSSSFRRLTK